MKYSWLLILIFCSYLSISQQVERKIFISVEYGIEGVQMSERFELEKEAIKVCDFSTDSIIENKVELRIEFDDFPTIYSLIDFSLNQFQTIQDSINSKEFCDYFLPIKIDVIENGKLYRISWKRIQNCYPKNALFVDTLDKELQLLCKIVKNNAP